MRMLHVADRLPDRGGAGTHMLSVVRALSARHEVMLAVGCSGDVDAPCPVIACPGVEARDDVPVPALEALASRGRFDMVHVHNVVNPRVLRWASARPAVVTVQDHRFFCPGRGKWRRDGGRCREAFAREVCAACFEERAYFEEVLALTRARFDALRHLPVIVLSAYMRSEFTEAGLDAERVHVIPPFVDGLDEDAEADGPACVAFVGRLVEAKGVRDAVAAWRGSGVGLPLVFAGTGPLRGELEREGFEVLGWLDRPRLSALYRRAAAVLMPPRWQEPFGIAGLESLRLGTPVVAWESGGIGEWHPEPLAGWGDVEGLAELLRAAIGVRAAGAEGFDRAGLMARLEAVYHACRAPASR